jgi:hypothetical protein
VSVVTAFLLAVFGWFADGVVGRVAMDPEKQTPGRALIRSTRGVGLDPESPESSYVFIGYKSLYRTVNLETSPILVDRAERHQW